VHCEGCGKEVRKGQYQFDHDKANGLGGPPTFENCRLLCSIGKASCHAQKTEADKKIMQKADNVRNRYQGTSALPTRRIPHPSKIEREPRRLAAELPELPRRPLFKNV
jgi:5-methylcytosine-specific restriction enzyme A